MTNVPLSVMSGKSPQINFAFNYLAAAGRKTYARLDGRLQRDISRTAFINVILRLSQREFDKLDGMIAGKICNRGKTLEKLFQSFFQEPTVGIELKFNEVGDIHYVCSLLRSVLNLFQT